ncbi:hypothetical protein [Leifsonia sp. Le1]|uniref:hypothetical protein n=1 Tax=Leifsonia sp. Le1 TaxID=3404918 RepID=UPI003EC0729A
MTIAFNEGDATLLIGAAKRASNELRDQGIGRRRAAETAAEHFTGAYARLFEAACDAESEDRVRLAGVLDDLAGHVHDAIGAAQKEEQRIADLAAWKAREVVRERQRAAAAAMPTPFPDFFDPKPSETPYAAPTVSAAFAARDRTRTSSGGTSGGSSADPAALMIFVGQANASNTRMEGELTSLRNSWSRFTSTCSWVKLGTVSFLGGFKRLLAENRADSDWIERVAAAFELAGSGRAASAPGTGMLSDAALGLATGALKRYRGSLVLPGKNAAQILDLLDGSPGPGWVKVLHKGKVYWRSSSSGFMVPDGFQKPQAMPGGKPEGWYHKPVFSGSPSVGTPPTWARVGGRALGVAGIGLTLWGTYADSYNETLLRHPQWTDAQRQNQAFSDTVTVGSASVVGGAAGAMAGAAVGAAIGSIFPGPGTIIGGIVGGIIGGVAAGEAAGAGAKASHGLGGADETVVAPGVHGSRPVGAGVS